MTVEQETGRPTRMLFMGDESLADGFRLIGFEAHPDPEPEDVNRVVRDLVRGREKAFIVVDDRLMASDIPFLERVRNEGGRIVVIAVPALNAPPELASEVAERLSALFGAAALGAAAPGTAGSGDTGGSK